MIETFRRNNLRCSISTTRMYSTSFSLGVRMLDKNIRKHIYSIYGFVRYADEIVDTFLNFDRKTLLQEFREDTFKAIERGISLNPILDSFQNGVNTCKIDRSHINAFLDSMEMDLNFEVYDKSQLQKYIYGSAEVVGLMCLRVFYVDDDEGFEKLKYPAQKLGEAFQKINFLRDAHDDYQNKGRIYFKNIDFGNFTPEAKKEIEHDIQFDFEEAFKGIVQLKPQVRMGVYLAYRYYLNLFEKIKQARPDAILKERFSVSNSKKGILLFKALARNVVGGF
jgi:phytoene synthase